MSATAGDWLHVYRALFEHPKAKRLAKRLGMDVPAAAGYLICLWTWAMAIAPDGDLARFEDEDIEAAAGWGGDDGAWVKAATDCRWLDATEGGLRIHDWDDWAGPLVLKRAKERKRSADRRAKARKEEADQRSPSVRTQVDQRTTDGRPAAVQRPTDGRERGREKREKERTPPTPPAAPQPVDNSAGQERGGSIDQEEQGQEPVADAADPSATDAAEACGPDSCDGAECSVRGFPESAFTPLRRAMLASLHAEQREEVGKGGDLDRLLEEYARHICAACQAALGEFARPQLDGLCERAIVAGVENLKGSADVKAVMRSRLQRFGLAELVGDRVLEELRRTKRAKRRKGDPKPIGDCLPPAFAQPMPKPTEEAAS